MSAEDTEQFAKAVEAQYDREHRHDVIQKVADEVKASIAFQYSWEELLQSGPVALTCMGSCCIAAASNASQTLTLDPPRGGFQFLSHKSLHDNLLDSINHGYNAFITAERNLGDVLSVSTTIYSDVAEVMDMLMDTGTAKTQLIPQLNSMGTTVYEGYKKALEVDAGFDTWLKHAMELHAACVQTESSSEERSYATQLNMAVAQNRFAGTEQSVELAKEALDRFGKQADAASQAYKQASDTFPGGWDILGQQVVGALADTVTTAFGQLLTGFANNLNPTVDAQTGANMFNDLIHGGKYAEADKSVGTPEAPPTTKSTSPPHSFDPAYAEVKTTIIYFGLINAVVTKGKDGGIDWDMGSGTDGASDKSVSVALAMLRDSQGRFEEVATNEEPSRTLKSATEEAIEVATALQAEIDKSKDRAHKFPDAASATVKAWQKSFADAYSNANNLAAVARTLPGTVEGAPILSNTTEDPSVTISGTNAGSAQAQAVLESIKNRLTTTQQLLETTQQLYLESSKQLIEQQNKLAEIQGEVTRLDETELGLAEIKKILVQCIELMVQLKQPIMNLCRFFAAIKAAIDAVVKYTVVPFIASITAGDSGRRVGTYTLTDLTRTLIYQAVIKVRAYFSVHGDIVRMLMKLSADNIMPGLEMVQDMMRGDGGLAAAQRKTVELNAWSLEAQNVVKEISAATREKIEGSMQQRVSEIQRVTKELPPTSAAKRAIEAGAGEVLSVAKETIKANAAVGPINRFGMKGVY